MKTSSRRMVQGEYNHMAQYRLTSNTSWVPWSLLVEEWLCAAEHCHTEYLTQLCLGPVHLQEEEGRGGGERERGGGEEGRRERGWETGDSGRQKRKTGQEGRGGMWETGEGGERGERRDGREGRQGERGGEGEGEEGEGRKRRITTTGKELRLH